MPRRPAETTITAGEALIPGPRYALFWWWTAIALVTWDLAVTLAYELLPPELLPWQTETVFCSWMGSAPPPDWQWRLYGITAQAKDFLVPAIPVVLLLCVWTVARHGAGRPGVHRRAAFAGVGLIALQYALELAGSLLDPMPADAQCGVDPATINSISPAEIAWFFAPAVVILIAAWTGMRPARLGPVRARRAWRRPVAVAAGVAVPLVAAGLVVVRLVPERDAAPALAADGTPRYALVLAGDRLAVLDLVEPGAPTAVAAPDPRFYQFTAITRDRRPGEYLAAVTSAGNGAMGGRSSRIYRVRLTGDGDAEIGEQVGGDLDGLIADLAVSPGGRIAYSVLLGRPDGFDVAATSVGLVQERRVWSAPGGQGEGDLGTGPLGLHWRDEHTLVFRAHPPKARSPRLVALDVRRPGADLFAAAPLYRMGAMEDGVGLGVPGTDRLVVSRTDFDYDQQILILDPPAKRPAGSVFAAGCGNIAAFTLDASGRYLLVSVDNKAGVYTGDPPRPICGDVAPFQVFRVDLRPAPGAATPEPGYPGDPVRLGLPSTRVWEGSAPVFGIAW